MLVSANKAKTEKRVLNSALITRYASLMSGLLVAGLTVLAFSMRRKGLATQSLWFDEADLLARAQRDVGTLLGDFLKPGENGPLYTLFMHFWVQVAGTGEAALRTPSLLAGTLLVPLVYALGRKFLGGRSIGLVAATLIAVSPYQIWYSQDAKMYPLALLLTLASVYLFLTALERGGRVWWVAYVILTTLSFYVHLMSALIVAVQVFYYLLIGRKQISSKFQVPGSKFQVLNPKLPAPERVKITGTRTGENHLSPNGGKSKIAIISLSLLTVPYLPIALWQGRALWDGGIGKTWLEPIGLFPMLDTLGRRFGVNRIPDPFWESFGAFFFATLALLGLWAGWKVESRTHRAEQEVESELVPSSEFQVSNPKSPAPPGVKITRPRMGKNHPSPNGGKSPALLLTLYLLFPILGFYLLTMRIPLFADRYLLIASPAYYLLAAWGLVWLGRKGWLLGWLAGGAALAISALALFSFNWAEEPQKEDWREALRWLQSEIRPGDEIILLPGYVKSVVDYYLKPTEVPVHTVPQDLLDGSDLRSLSSYLFGETGITRGHERVWIIESPDRYKKEDPQEYLRETWFKYNTWMFEHPRRFVGVNVYGYTFKQIPGTNADYYARNKAGRTDLKVGSSLVLEGFDLIPTARPGGDNLPSGQVSYDSYLHLSLYWRKIAPDPTNYEVKVRLLDMAGNDTNTNYNSQPLNGYYPTSQWKEREAVRDYRDLYIKVPPGQYQLEISLYPVGQPQQLLAISGSLNGQQINAAPKLKLPEPVTVLIK